MQYRIRFNKTRGLPNRGSSDHVWRVFDENNKEYVCKHIIMNCPSKGMIDPFTNTEWNIVCEGTLSVDRETSTVTIN
jgi:hypothetical protein